MEWTQFRAINSTGVTKKKRICITGSIKHKILCYCLVQPNFSHVRVTWSVICSINVLNVKQHLIIVTSEQKADLPATPGEHHDHKSLY